MFLAALKAYILNIPGIKFNANGYTIDKPKLNKKSKINKIWQLLYITQKQDIKYQKNIINIFYKIK